MKSKKTLSYLLVCIMVFTAAISTTTVFAASPEYQFYDFENNSISPFTGNGTSVVTLEDGNKVLRTASGNVASVFTNLGVGNGWSNYEVEFDVYAPSTTTSGDVYTRVAVYANNSSYEFRYTWDNVAGTASVRYGYYSYFTNANSQYISVRRPFGNYTVIPTSTSSSVDNSTILTSVSNGVPVLDMTQYPRFKIVWNTDKNMLEFWINNVLIVRDYDDYSQRTIPGGGAIPTPGGGIRLVRGYSDYYYDNITIRPVSSDIESELKCYNNESGEEIEHTDVIEPGTVVKVAGDITKNLAEIQNNLELVLAVYDKDNAMIDYRIQSLNFSEDKTQSIGEDVLLNVPEDTEGCKIKAFLWSDSDDTMISIIRPIDLH